MAEQSDSIGGAGASAGKNEECTGGKIDVVLAGPIHAIEQELHVVDEVVCTLDILWMAIERMEESAGVPAAVSRSLGHIRRMTLEAERKLSMSADRLSEAHQAAFDDVLGLKVSA